MVSAVVEVSALQCRGSVGVPACARPPPPLTPLCGAVPHRGTQGPTGTHGAMLRFETPLYKSLAGVFLHGGQGRPLAAAPGGLPRGCSRMRKRQLSHVRLRRPTAYSASAHAAAAAAIAAAAAAGPTLRLKAGDHLTIRLANKLPLPNPHKHPNVTGTGFHGAAWACWAGCLCIGWLVGGGVALPPAFLLSCLLARLLTATRALPPPPLSATAQTRPPPTFTPTGCTAPHGNRRRMSL